MKLFRIAPLFIFASFLISACSDKDEPEVDEPTPPVVDEPARYAVGDYYKSGNVEGIVFYISDADAQHGMIVSLEEWTDVWSTEETETGAISPSSSQYNMEVIKSRKDWKTLYPAFRLCDGLNSSRVIGWMLPCSYDLDRLYQGFNGGAGEANADARAAFNKALTDNGGMPITDDIYWTSTEYSYFGVYGIDFGTGEFCYPSDGDKVKTNIVRAVKSF